MAFSRTRDTGIPEATLEVGFDVFVMRRISDHPDVAVLLRRKETLQAKMDALARDRQRHREAIEAIERSQGLAIAELGDDWQPPAEMRQAQESILALESQERIVQSGIYELNEQIDAATGAARAEVEAELNRMRRPLLDVVVNALSSIVEANKQIHAIEAKSQKLLGFGQYHLVDGGLDQRLQIMQRTQHLLDLAANEA